MPLNNGLQIAKLVAFLVWRTDLAISGYYLGGGPGEVPLVVGYTGWPRGRFCASVHFRPLDNRFHPGTLEKPRWEGWKLLIEVEHEDKESI